MSSHGNLLKLIIFLFTYTISVSSNAFFRGIKCTPPSKNSIISPRNVALNIRGGEVLEAKTPQELSTILSTKSLAVIDFSATWCGPCKMIAPFYEELSNLFPQVAFVKVDVDENPDTAAEYGVSAMPTFIFLKNGEIVEKLMGANPQKLKELIEGMS